LLEIKNIDAGYDFLQILWDVSLKVDEGEFVALVGPNGAGKTTTLRTVAGLIKPTKGGVLFNGQTISGLKAHEISRLGIAYVSEGLNLFTNMSVYENLLLGAYAVHDKKQRDDSLAFVFDLFPRMQERSKQLAGLMSGGERKMLAIGRGIMSNPKVLLRALSERGVTILLVEQNVHMTLEITHRAYVLEQGRVALEGPSRELKQNEHVRKAYMGI
jgi:branched-chain amino acid transport system ATP-binding protein